MKLRHRITGIRVGAVLALTTAAAIGTLTLAPAAALANPAATPPLAATATAHPTSNSGPATQARDSAGITSYGACLDYLAGLGYTPTLARKFYCVVAQVGGAHSDPAKAILGCTIGLMATWVNPVNAVIACGLGAAA